MMRIRVDTNYLQEVGHQVSNTVNALRSMHKQPSSAWRRLDVDGWEGQHRELIEPWWWQVRSRLGNLVEQTENLAHFLDERAVRFEEADHAGAAAVGSVVVAFAQARREWNRWFRPRRVALSFPHTVIGRLLRLGRQEGHLPSIFVVTPTNLGNRLVGTRYLRPTPPRWRQPLEKAVERYKQGAVSFHFQHTKTGMT